MNPLTINGTTFTLKLGVTPIAGTVTYSGSTATFSPLIGLMAGSVYTATITTGAENPAGNPLANNYVWTFTTVSLSAPMVLSTDPINNATAVVLNKVVTATFNMPMDPLTMIATTFTLKQGTTTIPGTVSFSGTTISYKPTSNLVSGTTYTATITTAAKSAAGTAMAANYVWTFTTGTITAPTVIATDPINLATGVAFNKTVTATFSVPMDPLTINSTTFTLKLGTTPVTGTITYSGNTASFKPLSNLISGTTYTATITTGAKNLAGVAMANNYVWTFTTLFTAPTVIATDPVNNATLVGLSKVVAATFSVPMNPATINGTTFTLKQGTTVIAGTVSYTGSAAYFTPTSKLLSNTIYTATITTGAKNLAGTALAANYVWTFTTMTVIAPTVISTDPINGATLVPLNKLVTATFSVAMNPLTINGTTFIVKLGAITVAGVVTYSGTTATFTPTVNLLSGSVYTATITTGAENIAGTALAIDYIWSFTTVATPPTVILTDPLNTATNVALNKAIKATFSVPMDPLSITSLTYTLKLGATSVAGTVTLFRFNCHFYPYFQSFIRKYLYSHNHNRCKECCRYTYGK